MDPADGLGHDMRPLPRPMRTGRHRLTEASLDRLLDGGPEAATSGDTAALAALLAAASAPGRPDELRGLHQAVAAYSAVSWRTATSAPAPRPWRNRMIGKLVTIKVAAAAVSALSLGGVAVAAYSNALPEVLQTPAHDVFGGVGVPGPPSTSTLNANRSRHNRPTPQVTPTPSVTPTGSPSASPTALPSRIFGLCTAENEAIAHGTLLGAPVQAYLDQQAGGASNVAAFCAAHGQPATHPSATPSGRPTSGPSQSQATDHPSGPPASPGSQGRGHATAGASGHGSGDSHGDAPSPSPSPTGSGSGS